MKKYLTLKVVLEVPAKGWTQPQIRQYFKDAVSWQAREHMNRDPETTENDYPRVESVYFAEVRTVYS